MDRQFGVIVKDHVFLRSEPGEDEEKNLSSIEDDAFSGWAVRIRPETEENGWVKVCTHYGYEGYLKKKDLREIDEQELIYRQDKTRFFRINIGEADLLDRPKVQGLPLEVLFKNALAELLESDENGWSHVRTASGKEGYLHTEYLSVRKDDDEFLLEGMDVHGYFAGKFPQSEIVEEKFRQSVAESARAYLGVQYRWGGKASQGIDCSGLAFISYMENGVLIYRDAQIREGYPIHPIESSQLKKGDLIFFPGHVAMYLGERKYIHSTAFQKTPYVTVNSLNPEDEDYREDLAGKIVAYGSLF